MVKDGRDEVQRSAERSALSQVSRSEKHQTIAAKAAGIGLGNPGPFPLLLADPPKDARQELSQGTRPGPYSAWAATAANDDPNELLVAREHVDLHHSPVNGSRVK